MSSRAVLIEGEVVEHRVEAAERIRAFIQRRG
jgi:hypothetical protein